MKKTIEKLYKFQKDNVPMSSDTEKFRQVYSEMLESFEKLKAVVGKDNMNVLEEYASREEKVCDAVCEKAFADGFSLAVRLMTEALGK